MDVDEILKVVFSIAAAIIASVGGAGVIILGLSAWLGNVWAKRIHLKNSSYYNQELEKLKNSYAIELEHLKSEISQKKDLLSASLDADSKRLYLFTREKLGCN
jgi:uncharacterized membrane protein